MDMNYLREIRVTALPEDAYWAELPAVRQIARDGGLKFRKPVTFFVGENGTGKSTLLEAIAVHMGFNAEGGSREFFFSTRDSHSDLHEYLRSVRFLPPKDGFFLRAESFYNTATYLEQNSSMQRYGGQSLHSQSHGESFLSLVMNRFAGRGLYLLDEPEAALSPQRLLTLLICIDRLVKKDSQFLIATHSPILSAYPGAEILEFSEEGFRPVEYKDTANYQITREFLNHPEKMLAMLLEGEEE
ncbi:MAG: AAA family ATPase [Lachnospiraceae bacterium]|nr:AAA family ATPase [Lachnospiraceae bacterium]